ncbi:hypothetical protein SODALDRAFT_359150 [Sodiomyces alkalinus F11]|uniref:Copper homeostasis protein cutC homolog n=1 Tax=Sodiomyces alkalinus (strain CBS 110278 / VKM F-3762 / F11) TaxID=1314773 RepID=A0A3N2PXR2_SODAK|nr:hypothetical protein SODALDRAFT_359150 [Sodiomyces alkalinus F11]ROT39272.1 hypothetical protein SODALDRAFT_359150 [Sodiomyces alkalinus F11]
MSRKATSIPKTTRKRLPLCPLEVPIFSPAVTLQSQCLPIARIELKATASYPAGGLTPPLRDVQCITSLTTSSSPSPSPSPPSSLSSSSSSYGSGRPSIRVMIRPRGPRDGGRERDFIYSDAEFQAMLSSVANLLVRDRETEVEAILDRKKASTTSH